MLVLLPSAGIHAAATLHYSFARQNFASIDEQHFDINFDVKLDVQNIDEKTLTSKMLKLQPAAAGVRRAEVRVATTHPLIWTTMLRPDCWPS